MSTMQIIWTVLLTIGAYFLGGLSPAVILSTRLKGEDIRKKGSGNAGSTNMLRNHGIRMGALTFALDLIKGVIPALLALLWLGPVAAFFASIAVVIGHIFPVLLGFRGGKGVATAIGVLLVLQPILTLIVLVLAVGLVAITGYVSLGSILGISIFPFCGFLIPLVGWQFGIFSLVLALLVLWKHKENIERLLKHQENKMEWRKLKK